MAYVDPIAVSPEYYHVVLEDAGSRLLMMSLPPGKSDKEHSHPGEMIYFLQGGKIRVHEPGKDPTEIEVPTGHSMEHEAWTHRIENVGPTEIKALIFERK
jgi:quercetin dioxygenase-like cupin family protein